jgi:mono/diheme cytochrome c family protein
MTQFRKLMTAVVGYSLVAVAWAGDSSLIRQVPPPTATLKNPFEGQESAKHAGAKLFARECAPCHATNGRGGVGKAPPLVQPAVYEAEPGSLFWILRNGSLGRGMPSFAHLPEPQRWQLVTYLKSLGRRSSDAGPHELQN